MGNPIQNVVFAAVVFLGSIIGTYVGYFFMKGMLDGMEAVSPVNPLMTGLAWLAFVVLSLLATFVVPAVLLFQAENQ